MLVDVRACQQHASSPLLRHTARTVNMRKSSDQTSNQIVRTLCPHHTYSKSCRIAGAFGNPLSGTRGLYRRLLATPWARALQSGAHTRPGYQPTLEDRAGVLLDDSASSTPSESASSSPCADSDTQGAQPPRAEQERAPTNRQVVVRSQRVSGEAAERDTASQTQAQASQVTGTHDKVDRIAALALTDRVSMCKAAESFPRLLEMSEEVVVARILRLKALLPGAHQQVCSQMQYAHCTGTSCARAAEAGVNTCPL